jgi:transaldolase
MKFFIDTGDVSEIRKANEMGLIDGVTTNPSLIAKSGRTREEVIGDIVKIVNGPISAECVTTTRDELIKEGKVLAKIHDNVVVKLPMGLQGLAACKALTSEGIKTNVTLCFTANQALLAAKVGATYISPFVGRLDDISTDGMELIADIVQIYQNYDYETQVLVASVRHPIHVLQAAKIGAHVATIPFKIIEQLAEHPLTTAGLKKFTEDYEKALAAAKK